MQPNRHARAAVLAVAVLGAVVLVPRIGTSALWDPWEPKYVQSARELARRGDWAVPYYRDDPRLNKPPMTYWLIAASRAAFGQSEAAARLPSAILACLCAVGLAAALASRGRALEGLLAGAALVTMPQWVLLGRFATPDIPMAAALGLTLAAVLARERERRSRLVDLLVPVGVAFAAMTDWPRGLLLPLWAVLVHRVLSGPERPGAWRRWAVWPVLLAAVAGTYHAGQMLHDVPLNLASIGLLALAASGALVGRVGMRRFAADVAIVVVLVAPWFLVIVSSVPADEWSVFEYKHALNLGESPGYHQGPYLEVLRTVLVGGLPWSVAAVLGLLMGWGRKADPVARIAAAAWIGPWLFFTLAEPRMGHFYGVMQPAVALLAAVGLVAAVRRPSWRLAPALLAAVWAGRVVLDRPAEILAAATVKSNLFGFDLRWTALGVLGVWLAIVAAAVGWRRPGLTGAGVVPALVLVGVLGWQLVPTLEPKKSLGPMWRAYQAQRSAGEPIGLFGPSKDSAYYYSDLAIERLKRSADVQRFLGRPGGRRFLILQRSRLEQLEGVFGRERIERLVTDHPSHVLIRYTP